MATYYEMNVLSPSPHREELGRKVVHSPPITESMVKFRPNVFSINGRESKPSGRVS